MTRKEDSLRHSIQKTITIRADQQDFIVKKSMNLSWFVQRKLDEEIEREKGVKS